MSSTTSGPPTSTASSTSTASCTSATPGDHGYVPFGACNNVWPYYVHFAPPAALFAVFAILAITHFVFAIMTKKAYCWVMTMGVLWEAGGYASAAWGSRHQDKQAYYQGYTLFVFLAPLWVNAFVYMTLGRMIHYFLPDRRVWIFKGRLLGRTFVLADISCFIVQLIGIFALVAGASNNNASTQQTGMTIYKVGIGLQEAFICLFLGLLIAFQVQATRIEKRTGTALRPQSWQWLTYTLYIVLAMITARIIYRLLEYRSLDPNTNPLPFHEVYPYTLDGLPMFLACLALAIIHPGRALVGPDSNIPRGAAKKELKRWEKEQKARRKSGKKGITDEDMGTYTRIEDTGYNTGYNNNAMNQMELGRYGGSDEHLMSRT